MRRLPLFATLFALAACGPSGKITGKIVLPGDASNVSVTAVGPVTRVAAVGSDGAYTFENLPDGMYLVETSNVPSTVERSQSARVEVKDGAGTAPDMTFKGLGGISGRVSAPSGVNGAEVFLAGQPFRTVTSDDGQFEFSNLPVGEYTLAAAHAGYEPVSTKVTVTYNQVASNQTLTLSQVARGQGRISGVARYFNKTDHSNITVTVVENPLVTARTDAEGKYTLIGAPLGYVTLSFSSQGYDTRTFPNVLSAQGGELKAGDVRLFITTQKFAGSVNGLSFSTDQSRMVFIGYPDLGDQYWLYAMDTTTPAKAVKLMPAADTTLSGYWQADSKKVAVSFSSARDQLWGVDLEAGTARLISRRVATAYYTYTRTVADKVFYIEYDDKAELNLWVWSFAGGTSTRIDKITSDLFNCNFGKARDWPAAYFLLSSTGRVAYTSPGATAGVVDFKEWSGSGTRVLSTTPLNCLAYLGGSETLMGLRDGTTSANWEVVNLSGASTTPLLSRPAGNVVAAGITGDRNYIFATHLEGASYKVTMISAASGNMYDPYTGGQPLEVVAQPNGGAVAIRLNNELRFAHGSGSPNTPIVGVGTPAVIWAPKGKKAAAYFSTDQQMLLIDGQTFTSSTLGPAAPDVFGIFPGRFSPLDGYLAWRQGTTAPYTTRLTKTAGPSAVTLPTNSSGTYGAIIFGPADQLAYLNETDSDRLIALTPGTVTDVNRNIISAAGCSFSGDDSRLLVRDGQGSVDGQKIFLYRGDGANEVVHEYDTSMSCYSPQGTNKYLFLDGSSTGAPPGWHLLTTP